MNMQAGVLLSGLSSPLAKRDRKCISIDKLLYSVKFEADTLIEPCLPKIGFHLYWNFFPLNQFSQRCSKRQL